MEELIYKDEAYEIVGMCMEVHNQLGNGLLEIIYKEAMELEAEDRGMEYEREKEYPVYYKNYLLKKKFFADFVFFNKIIVEIKAKDSFANEDIAQVINYLKLSKCKLGLLINFGKTKLEVKPIVC